MSKIEEVKVNLEEEETCVDCGKKLGYRKGLDIKFRPYYTEGNGDRCRGCYMVAIEYSPYP